MSQKEDEYRNSDKEKVGKLVRSWEQIANDETVAVRDRLKAGELLGKYHAIFSEKRIIEVPDRQKALDASSEAEAKLIASRRFEHLSLPPGDLIDVAVIPAVGQVEPEPAEPIIPPEEQESSEDAVQE